MGRKAIFYIIESQSYVERENLQSYLELYPTHTFFEVIADESVLTTSGSRMPEVKTYLRESPGSGLVTVSYSGTDVLVNNVGGSPRAVSNRRDINSNQVVNGNSFVVVSSLPYSGYLIEGTPTKALAIINVNTSSNNKGQVRLYDSTNNQVIAELEVNQPGKRTVDLGEIVYLPLLPCILEVQVRNTRVAGSTTFYTMTLIY